MSKESKDQHSTGALTEKDKSAQDTKKHKKRTKRIVALLKEQIEFYFSDSNLMKDRFMKQTILDDREGYVEIKTIANFNRMKQLTEDIQLVVKAMKTSPLLEVSKDEKKVRRTASLPEPKNVDAETIYVEKLPPYADHDWLKQVFNPCGKILYVSIPRFKQTGESKGFAFIEFESEGQAKAAVQMFDKGSKSKKEAEQDTENNSSASCEQKQKGKRKHSHSESEVDSSKHNEHKTMRKRKKTTSESSVDSVDSIDRQRTVHCAKIKGENTEKQDNQDEGAEARKRKKIVHWEESEKRPKSKEGAVANPNDEAGSHDAGKGDGKKRPREPENDEKVEETMQRKKHRATDSESNTECKEGEENKKKSKKRKRKKKEKKETRLPYLRVMSKLEWLNLKQEYKKLQRQAMQDLKKQLQEAQPKEPLRAPDENKPERETMEIKSEVKPKGELAIIPGVLLKFENQPSNLTKKDIREKFSSFAPVAYVDMEEGAAEGVVRFHTAENCTSVLENFRKTPEAGLEVQQLQGDEEKIYWKKINADRGARFKAKREKKRGTEKVTKRADAVQAKRQSHVRFDGGGEEPKN